MLEKEYEYFESRKTELVRDHHGQYVVIRDNDILGFFDSKQEALKEALNNYEAGEFLLKECREESDRLMRFHSRVSLTSHA